MRFTTIWIDFTKSVFLLSALALLPHRFVTALPASIRQYKFKASLVGLIASAAMVSACDSSTSHDTITIAVASNFTEAAQAIGQAFHEETNVTTNFSFASTGKLHAQIRQGAPFDVFLAADQKTPAACVDQGDCVADSTFTYARGKLVLISHAPAVLSPGVDALHSNFNHLAIANPVTAPYGEAAIQTLTNLGLADTLSKRLILGDSVTQAFLFVASGATELGFVAWSQVRLTPENEYWVVPQQLYTPLSQNAVLSQRGGNNPAARKFLEFLRSEKARTIIRAYGYETDVPD